MQKLRKTLLILMVTVLGCGISFSAAAAGTLKKVITFHKFNDSGTFVVDWEPFDLTPIMAVKCINGLIVSVPDTVTSADLAADPRVASVDDDGHVEMPAITASGEGGAGEGGAGEGGANVFITLAPQIPASYRPWGVLNVFTHPYDPFQVAGYFDKKLLPPLELEAAAIKLIKNVRIAVFDTGVEKSHTALINTISGGFDFVHMREGIPVDDNGHGTHVAATLAGKTTALINGVELYCVKVLDQNAGGDLSSVIMALQWAIDNKMNVVNMSFAFREDKPIVHAAIQKARDAGIILVAAVGNHSNWLDDTLLDGTGEGGAGEGGAGEGGAASDGATASPYPVMYPAAYPEVIAVGAMDAFQLPADFSNTGPELTLYAPGTNVFSANLNGTYGLCSGTSMAVPHVAAAAAMMLALDDKKTLSPADVKNILKQTAVDGKLNLLGALWAVRVRQ